MKKKDCKCNSDMIASLLERVELLSAENEELKKALDEKEKFFNLLIQGALQLYERRE